MNKDAGYSNAQREMDDFLEMLPGWLERFPDVTGKELRRYQEEVVLSMKTDDVLVAVTGKIKQAKSTLINALINRDLPTTGITEATATLNFIKHLSRDQNSDPDKFFVRWKDELRPDTVYELSEFEDFRGESGKSKQPDIADITMYADAKFLKEVTLVDTPGEQGQFHSIKFKPDALIRAFPFEAEENDLDKLEEYARETREMGSLPYNTIAVIQKWEQYWPPSKKDLLENNIDSPFEISPLDMAWLRAKYQQEIFKDVVAKVIPVSGLLWWFASTVSTNLLERMHSLCSQSTREDLVKLMTMEKRFITKDVASSDSLLRSELFNELKQTLGQHSVAAWPIMKMIIWTSVTHELENTEGLRQAVKKLSNMETAREELDTMFFKRAKLLKKKGALTMACSIADDANYKLNLHHDELEDSIRDADTAMKEMNALSLDNNDYASATRWYITHSQNKLVQEKQRLKEVIGQLETANQNARKQGQFLDMDIYWMERIDSQKELRSILSDRDEIERLKALTGQYGGRISSRLRLNQHASNQEITSKIFNEFRYWRNAMEATCIEDHIEISKYAVKRLNFLKRAID